MASQFFASPRTNTKITSGIQDTGFIFKTSHFIVLTRQPHIMALRHGVTSFLQQAQGRPFPGVHSQHSSGESDIKAFPTATRSFDVWVVEHKLTGQFVFNVVHFCSQKC